MNLEKYKQLYSDECKKYREAKEKGLIAEKWIAQGKKEALAIIINDIVCDSKENTDELNNCIKPEVSLSCKHQIHWVTGIQLKDGFMCVKCFKFYGEHVS